jgi:hypothetical protein
MDPAEKLTGHPEGCVELKLKVLGEHPEESLFVTDRL